MNRRIVLSSLSIFASAALIAGATFAFFTDEEKSSGNVFAAGSLNLKVDSEAHYAGLVCNANSVWQLEVENGVTTRPDLVGKHCDGTWAETDLGVTNKFFNLGDIKPGDDGENTISLHVIDNDAWGQLLIGQVKNWENLCTDSEVDVHDPTCGGAITAGELGDNLLFEMWLDQGTVPGFQGTGDAGEGDNIWQTGEPPLISEGTIDEAGEVHIAAPALAAINNSFPTCDADDGTVEDGQAVSACPGLTSDGHMVGSITYYLGLNWRLPDDVGDIVQTDSLVADMTFAVEQYRNNPTPTPPI